MKKIILVEPKPPDFHIFSRFALPRLGTLILGTILKKAGYDTKVMVETLAPLNFRELLKADLVGISTITSTAPRAYAIARELKKQGIIVVMGGPHPSFLPEEALGYCNYVLRGEAEESILKLISAIEKKQGFEDVAGLSFRVGERIYHNQPMELCPELDSIPFPDFSLLSTRLKNVKPVLTSRGCPFNCSFCVVSELFGRKYRFRTVDNVLEELSKIAGKEDTVFFYDDNFCANPVHTKQLLTRMIEEKITPQWTAQVRADVYKDEELVELFRRSNCYFLYIGMESINPETLKAYKKQITLDEIEKAVKCLHKHKIRIHGMFVLGSDSDDINTIESTSEFAIKNKIDTVQFMILTPVPGTKFFEDMEKENRILTKDWSLYDGHHIVFKPLKMTPYQLQIETIKAMSKFYSLFEIIRLFIRFDFISFIYRSYGHRLIKKWKKDRENLRYFQMVREFTSKAGEKLDNQIRKTAEDILNEFKRLTQKIPNEASIVKAKLTSQKDKKTPSK